MEIDILPFSDGQMRQKRGLIAPPGAVKAVYTPTEEVIVKLNGAYDGKQFAAHHGSNSYKWPNDVINQEHEDNPQLHHLIKSANAQIMPSLGSKRSILNSKQSAPQQSNLYFVPNESNRNSNDDDDELINDYNFDYYLKAPMNRALRMQKQSLHPIHRWMKSTDSSQNRDVDNLSRGSETSHLY